MATFRKFRRADGAFTHQAIVRREGMRPRYASFPNRRDAERWAQRLEGDWARHRHFPDEESSRRTLGDAIDRWIRDELPSRRSRQSLEGHLRWWQRRIGDLTLARVTPAVLSEIKAELAAGTFQRATPGSRFTSIPAGELAQQFRRSPATVNRYLQALSSVLSHASREWYWLPDNPLRHIRKLKQPPGRARYLSDAERTRLLKACTAVDRQLHAFVVAAIATGARAGELLALRWDDVDLKKGRAVLHRSKNEDRRMLTLAGPALKAIKRQRRQRRRDTDRVFPHASLDAPFDYHKPFRQALAAAEIADFRFHDLRHSAASYLAMSGASGPEIAAVLGHRTLAMVKRYAHLSDQHVAGVVERMVTQRLGG